MHKIQNDIGELRTGPGAHCLNIWPRIGRQRSMSIWTDYGPPPKHTAAILISPGYLGRFTLCMISPRTRKSCKSGWVRNFSSRDVSGPVMADSRAFEYGE